MTLIEVRAELSKTMKEGMDKDKVIVLRGIIAKAQEIAKADKNREVTDEDIITACIKLNIEATEGIEIYKNLEGVVARDNYIRNVRQKKITESILLSFSFSVVRRRNH